MILGRLDRYVLRRFLGYYGLALLYLVGLYCIVDVVLQMERFLDARPAIESAGRTVAGAVTAYYAATLPLMVLQVAPFVTVTAAAMALVDLRRRNELAPMLGAGRSMVRILFPILGFAALLTIFLVHAQDRLAPRAVARRLEVERSLRGEAESTSTRVPHVRDAAGNVWSIVAWDPSTLLAEGIRVAPFRGATLRASSERSEGRGQQEYGLLVAARMRWRDGTEGTGWYPEEGLLLKRSRDDGGATPSVSVPGDRPLPTSLRPEDINLARDSADLQGMSRRRIVNLMEANPGLRNLPVLLHRRITYPLANLILLLVGVPLILRSRSASLFIPALGAMGVCAAYFVVDTVGCDLASRGIVPAAVGAWSAVVLFGAAGVTMLESMFGEG